MSANPLAVISTRLAPGECGIGAHSLLLRKHWPGAAQPVDFLVMQGSNGADVLTGHDRIAEFGGEAKRLQAELDRIGRADVVLHYAGRAYQRFGFPHWMPGVLRRWKQRNAGARLLVLFHEVPGGDLPITSRYFWLDRLNLSVIRQLARIADVLVTNTETHAQQLRRVSGRSDVHLLPIGSNIEVAADDPHTRAATEFVIFGLPFGRLQVIRTFDAHLRQWHATGKLTRLHVIGRGDDKFSTEADQLMSAWPKSLSVVRHGLLPSADVSRLLHTARFALTNVTAATWSKSGAFMACAFHRCAVVINESPPSSLPLACAIGAEEVQSVSDGEIERKAAALAEWAAQNADWCVIASRMAALLDERNGDGR
jgi:hypothetical protein